MKKIVLIAGLLVALLVLPGCIESGRGQNATAGSKAALLKKHVEVECPFGISGTAGIHMEVDDCVFELVPDKVEEITVKCRGNTGNKGTIAPNRESTFTVSFYGPDSLAGSRAMEFNTERNKADNGSCTIIGPTTDFGLYEIVVEPDCKKLSFKWTSGYKWKSVKCDFHDQQRITKEWF